MLVALTPEQFQRMVPPKAGAPAVWHYTGLDVLGASGEAPDIRIIRRSEDGLLWFSKNQRWEPTARQVALQKPNGEPTRRMTLDERARLMAAYRLGARPDNPMLLPWRDACDEVGMSGQYVDTLVREGLELGADPDDWLAMRCDIHINNLRFEAFDPGAGRWVPAREVLRPLDDPKARLKREADAQAVQYALLGNGPLSRQQRRALTRRAEKDSRRTAGRA